MKMIFQATDQDYQKSAFAEITITLDRDICGQNIRITYENEIPGGQNKIIKNTRSQKIQLHWTSIFVARI